MPSAKTFRALPATAALLLLLNLPTAAPAQADAARTRQLAEKLAAARTEGERDALLAAGKELLTNGLVEALVGRVGELRFKGELVEALRLSRVTVAVAERIGEPAGVARAAYMTGVVHYHRGEYEAALEHYRRSLAMEEALKNQRGIATALTGIGLVYRTQGDFDGAMRFYRRGLEAAEAAGDKVIVANTLNLIGVTYRLQGNRRLALEHFQKALPLFEEANNQAGVTGLWNNIGNIYLQQGQYDLAVDSFRKSLELAEKSKYRTQSSIALNNIGRVHHLRGDHTKALDFYRQSLAIREEIGDKTGAARVLTNIAEAHTETRDYDRALEYYAKTLALLESLGSRADLAVAAVGGARLHLLRGDHKSSLEWAGRAAQLARDNDRLDVLWQARAAGGEAYKSLGQHAEARAAFTEAAAVVEELRGQVAGGEQEQQRFFEGRVSPYLSLVELHAEQGEWGAAFVQAERAKARVLLDVLQSGRAEVARGMTVREREEERRLRGELVALNSQLARESQNAKPDASRLSELRSRREQARRNYEAFRTNLYAAHPELKIGRGEVEPVSLEEAGALLPDARSALVEYAVAGDKVFLFVLTKSAAARAPAELKVYRLGAERADVDAKAEAFRLSLARRDLTYSASARSLYDLLLAPAGAQLRGKTRLVIVPDGKLWGLPFQALQDARGRHLVEDYAISYAPSLTVLREMVRLRGRRPTAASPPSLLAVGNPSLGAERAGSVTSGNGRPRLMEAFGQLSPLPDAERQVKALAALYGPTRSRVYTGGSAREGRFKAEAGDYRVLQLATHGVLNDSAPMYSHVLFAREEEGGAEDGLLEAWELMGLDLKADLVVLSACETARGRAAAGEGVIGLTWALFVAGSPATVVSQWKVEASSTTELMLEFHRQLRLGEGGADTPKGVALQRAAKKMLAGRKHRHPFYWAGFVVVGDAN